MHHTYIYTYIHTQTQNYMRTYTHAHAIHTYIHTCTHKHIQKDHGTLDIIIGGKWTKTSVSYWKTISEFIRR